MIRDVGASRSGFGFQRVPTPHPREGMRLEALRSVTGKLGWPVCARQFTGTRIGQYCPSHRLSPLVSAGLDLKRSTLPATDRVPPRFFSYGSRWAFVIPVNAGRAARQGAIRRIGFAPSIKNPGVFWTAGAESGFAGTRSLFRVATVRAGKPRVKWKGRPFAESAPHAVQTCDPSQFLCGGQPGGSPLGGKSFLAPAGFRRDPGGLLALRFTERLGAGLAAHAGHFFESHGGTVQNPCVQARINN